MYVVTSDFHTATSQGPSCSQDGLSDPIALLNGKCSPLFEQPGPGGQSNSLLLLWFKMNAT